MKWFKQKVVEAPAPALPELPMPSNPALDAARAQIELIVQQATEKVDATILRLRAHLEERDRKEGRTV